MAKICACCKKKIGIFTITLTLENQDLLCERCMDRLLDDSDVELDRFRCDVVAKRFIQGRREFLERKKDREDLEAMVQDFIIQSKGIEDIYFNDSQNSFLILGPSRSIKEIHNDPFQPLRPHKIFNYNQIVSFELLEDETTITSGGLGRAAIGGAFFGAPGAVVGSITGAKKTRSLCESLKVKITLRHCDEAVQYIELRKHKSNTISVAYDKAHQILAMLQLAVEKVADNKTSADQQLSCADEILKFKSLMDQGIISAEEFEAKKQQLLNL
jgi:hypothetical protein